MHITDYIIELRGIHLYAYHGVMNQEKNIGAWFTLDIKLQISNHSCAINDEISDTISYADIYEIIKEEMNIPSNLLENVCNRISCRLFDRFDTIEKAEITLTKDTPPMGGDRLSAAVTIKAER